MTPQAIFTVLLFATLGLATCLDIVLGFDVFLTPKHKERDDDAD